MPYNVDIPGLGHTPAVGTETYLQPSTYTGAPLVFDGTSVLHTNGTQSLFGGSGLLSIGLSGSARFPSASAFQLPIGPVSTRPYTSGLPVSAYYGYIRYNTEYITFEGFGPGDTWGSLGGCIDIDRDTFWTALCDLSGGQTGCDYPGDPDVLRAFVGDDVYDPTDPTPNATWVMEIAKERSWFNNPTRDYKLGIGTTTPYNTLEVLNTATPQFRVTYEDNVEYATMGVDSTGQLDITTNTASPSGAHICLVPDGFVGIGNTNPGYTLHVSGSARIEGDLVVNGNWTALDTLVNVTSAMDITNHGTGPALQVNQTGTQPVADFQDDGATAFYIEDGGNVGLGTDNPGTSLHVMGYEFIEGTNPGLRLMENDNPDGNWDIQVAGGTLKFFTVHDDHTNFDQKVTFLSGGNVGIGTPSPGSKLEVAGNLDITRDDASYSSVINFKQQGNRKWSIKGGETSGEWDFAIRNANEEASLTILQDGNVGIGTAGPDAKLHVDVGASGYIKLEHEADGYSGLEFDQAGATRSYFVWDDSRDAFDFYAGGGTISDIKMTIKETGNVGIGTTDPKCHLESEGTIRARSGTQVAPSSGTGIEMFHNGVNGCVFTFDRTAAAYGDTIFNQCKIDSQGRVYPESGTSMLCLPTGNYGSIEVNGPGSNTGGWPGYSINGNYNFMANDAGTACGLYNDVDNEWMVKCEQNAGTHLYHNGSDKLETTSGGISVDGNGVFAGNVVTQGGTDHFYSTYNSLTVDGWTGMGTSYTVAADGSGFNNFYGICNYHDNLWTDASGAAYTDGTHSFGVAAQTGHNIGICGGGTLSISMDMNNGHIRTIGNVICSTINTGNGATEIYDMNQDLRTDDAVSFATVNTGQGANELYDMNQNVKTTSAVTFATVNTGQGANELYDMNQNVKTTNNVVFEGLAIGGVPTVAANTIKCEGDIIAFATSDITLKDNIKPITNAIDKISLISGVEFDWKQSYLKKIGEEDNYLVHKHDVGVIAQEIEEVLPEVVGTREDGTKAVKYEKIVPLLIEGIKDQQKQIDLLQEQVNLLRANL